MHHRSNFYIYFGLWVAVLPFIGVPGIWKVYLTCISGLIIALHASSPMIIKRLQVKAPRQRKKVVKSVEISNTDSGLRFNEPSPQEDKPEVLSEQNTEEKV
jgi:hypothetical protein